VKRLATCLIFCVVTLSVFAQSDSISYYRKYNESLIISLYQSFARQFDITIDEKFLPDTGKSAFHYYSDASIVSGIAVDYDKFGVAVGFRTKPPEDAKLKGDNKYFNLALNVGGIKWRLESSYRRYRGFYDDNTKNYDTTYREGVSPYYHDNSMINQSLRFKFLYFLNHKKFAYKSAYGSNYRQTKSSASWMLLGNLYFNRLSADSSLFPAAVRNYYESYADLNRLRVIGISAGGGFSWNLIVFKRFFYNLTIGVGADAQWRKYHHADGAENDLMYISGSGDVRSSFGYNADKFFFFLSSLNDISNFDSRSLKIKSSFVSGAFQVGYRFPVKTPGFYKKLQETKVYKML
jgi:hypothetical protein